MIRCLLWERQNTLAHKNNISTMEHYRRSLSVRLHPRTSEEFEGRRRKAQRSQQLFRVVEAAGERISAAGCTHLPTADIMSPTRYGQPTHSQEPSSLADLFSRYKKRERRETIRKFRLSVRHDLSCAVNFSATDARGTRSRLPTYPNTQNLD